MYNYAAVLNTGDGLGEWDATDEFYSQFRLQLNAGYSLNCLLTHRLEILASCLCNSGLAYFYSLPPSSAKKLHSTRVGRSPIPQILYECR